MDDFCYTDGSKNRDAELKIGGRKNGIIADNRKSVYDSQY